MPGEPGAYLINEFGLGFDEITASNLVKNDWSTGGQLWSDMSPAPAAGR